MQSQISDTFPSHCQNETISCYDPAAFNYTRPFSIHSESNPTWKQQNNTDLPPLSFFHFPSPPFEDTHVFLQQHHDFLLQFHHNPPPQNPDPQPVSLSVDTSAKKNIQTPRKRPGKRDRHSKISTAGGLRDRRMRLSLDVARRFFGLQDMLGFDKASKTVEWLLNQAKAEINRLAKEKKKQKKSVHRSCCSAGSECEEGVSSLDEVAVSRDEEEAGEERVDKVMKRRVKHSRKISAFHPLARECRERARERARERTREKMRSRGLAEESKPCREEENQNLFQSGSWKPSETGEEFVTKSHGLHPSLDEITEGKEHSYYAKEHDDDDDSLVILSKWSPSLIFNNYGFSHEVSLNWCFVDNFLAHHIT